MNQNEWNERIDAAVAGDRQALEELLVSAQDRVFNLALRMLGTVYDAEDATQEILVRMMTSLPSFRQESAFETWVYRIAVNYLLDYKRSAFAQRPLDFELYGNDIRYAKLDETDALIEGMDRDALAEELKMSCSNVMLQCFDAQSRCIFILGTMFRVDSRLAGEVLGMTPENYRQRLSRVRRRMAAFLAEHCGLADSPVCNCRRRVGYAVSQGRIDPKRMEFARLHPMPAGTLLSFREEMEKLDALACTFERFPCYRSPVEARAVLDRLLRCGPLSHIQQMGGGEG